MSPPRSLRALEHRNNLLSWPTFTTTFSVAFSRDGQRIVTGSGDRTSKVWEAASGEQVAKWQEEERTAAAVEPAPGNPR